MKNEILTISGYEYRLTVYLKRVYELGRRTGIKISYFKIIWNLDDIGYGRLNKAAQKLFRKGILIKPIIKGKEIRGSYKYNPENAE